MVEISALCCKNIYIGYKYLNLQMRVHPHTLTFYRFNQMFLSEPRSQNMLHLVKSWWFAMPFGNSQTHSFPETQTENA